MPALLKACHSVYSSLPERPFHVSVSVWIEGPNQRFSVRKQNISYWGHREPLLGPYETLIQWDRTPSSQMGQIGLCHSNVSCSLGEF